MFFLGFYRGFKLLTTNTTVKTRKERRFRAFDHGNHSKIRKNHQNSISRDGLKMVVFFLLLVFTVVLVFVFVFFVIFLGFYSGFELLTTKTTVKTRKTTRLYFERSFEHGVSLCFSLFLQCVCCCFSLLFCDFLGFYRGFELLTTKTIAKIKKSHEFSSFPNIASVGFATNPHNQALCINSTQLEMLLAL